MDLFYEKYADAVLFSALKIKPSDILSINTDEEDYAFARLLAEKAKKVTGNGSYVQVLENGRIKEEFDILSSFPLKASPTVFIYCSKMKKMDKITEYTELEPPALQRFRLLSDPLDNPQPSFPFISVPLPCKAWDELLDDEKAVSVIYNVLGFDNDDYLETLEMTKGNTLYLKDKANEKGFKEMRISNDEGTDISFRLLDGSSFESSIGKTIGGRIFSPYVFGNDIFRLVEPMSAEGWVNISKPIILFGKRISNLSIYFHEGKVKDVKGSAVAEALFSMYLRQDNFASWLSMVTISPSSALDDEEVTGNTDWDRMRNVTLTIGGPTGEAVPEGLELKTIDSIVTLSLPVYSPTTAVYAVDKDGEEHLIYSDGYLDLEDDE